MSDATPPPDDIAGLRAEVERAEHDLRRSIENTSRAIARGNRLQAERDALSARVEALQGENARLRRALETFAEGAEAVVDAITFDNSGTMGRGGNGGLVSQETIRKVDELRVLILRQRRAALAGEER